MFIKKISLVVTAFSLSFAVLQTVSVSTQAGSVSELAVLLPESDGVVVFNSKRLLNEALPQLLASDSPLLDKIDLEAERIKSKTGLDMRMFDEVAVGLVYKEIDGKTEFDAVALARGTVSTGSLKEVARTVSKGKFRTEVIGSREVYVFSSGELIKSHTPGKSGGDLMGKFADKVLLGVADELALTLYDSNTIAFGSYERVKSTIGNSPRISNELLRLLERKPGAIGSFGMKLPTGLSQFLELEDDDLGANLDSIREIQASIDVNDGVTAVSVAAKSAEAERAESLALSLRALKSLVSGVLSENKSPDKQAYSRMLENLEVTYDDKQIFMELLVPKSDLDAIVGRK